jgi:hypothetical protein
MTLKLNDNYVHDTMCTIRCKIKKIRFFLHSAFIFNTVTLKTHNISQNNTNTLFL